MAFKMKGMNHGEGTGSAYKNVGYTKEGPKSAVFQKTIAKRDFEAEILDKKKTKKKKKKLSKQEKFNKEVDFLRDNHQFKENIPPSILKRAKKVGLSLRMGSFKEEM